MRYMWNRRIFCRTRNHSAEVELLATILLGLFLSAAVVACLGQKIRPLAAAAAKAQAENMVVHMVEDAVLFHLNQQGAGYDDFVSIQRDNTGTITALTTNMAEMNRLRGQLLEHILSQLSGIRVSDLYIPLGSLFDLDILWARGPALKVHSMSVGSVSAEFVSEFTDAGVNQTLHRIWLEVRVPLTLILPGDRVDTLVDTRLCVAETVIVGSVPDTYLGMAG